MKFINDTCDNCKSFKKVVISENKLSKKLCASCIANSIDMSKSEELRKLSVTLEIPFDLKEYQSIRMSSSSDEEAMEIYLEYLATQNRPYENDSTFEWDEIDKHFNSSKSYLLAIAEIQPMREAIQQRGKEKWGPDFTFQEIIKLENLYENTVKQYNITSAIQQDAVKKAVTLSVSIDKLISTGDFKSLKDATAAMKQFLATADIENLAATSDDDTIRTVADLANYLEKNGFEFHKMLPVVEQDEIDRLMDNYVENVKDIVHNATGLEVQLQDFMEDLRQSKETDVIEDEMENNSLDDLDIFEDHWEEEEKLLDQQLDAEELEDDFTDEDIFL